ncbi:MAG: replication initiator [Microbacterium sp.]|uniref:replication initiator n=1 Tax=Microbacterium sp. TaxID=51671 RepID=UPI003F967A1A
MAPTAHTSPEFGDLGTEMIGQLLTRASSSTYSAWWARVTASGYCAHPIHLTRHDSAGASMIYARCKNRRSTVCPSCSDLYAGDTWHLVHAGLGGNDTIPATVAEHPAVFATLTAPGFGAVHSTRADETGAPRPCHPGPAETCRHGRTTSCTLVHQGDDELLGQPLCPDCYDYTGHVLTTWHTPALWDRFTRTLRRALRAEHGTGLRVSFVKVVELQTRGIPHIHAVIRLDAATRAGTPTPPLEVISGEELSVLVHRAAASVHLDVPAPGGEVRTLRFGHQNDTQILTNITGDIDGAVLGRKVAGYLAKYVTKSVADAGLSPHRLNATAIDHLEVSDHVRTLLHTIVNLSERVPEYSAIATWLHTLGYRGHITTKSRRYSTTMGALRARRAAHEQASAARHRSVHGDVDAESDETTDAEWVFTRAGHKSAGERYLAVTAALKHREELWAARQLGDTSTPVARFGSGDDADGGGG